MVAEGHTGPIRWDGTTRRSRRDRRRVIEQIFPQAGAASRSNTLCALAAESPRDGGARRAGRPSCSAAMRTIARAPRTDPPGRSGAAVTEGALPADADRALRRLAARRRSAVRPVDARPRAARRAGGRPLPESLRITGTVADWESWTAMEFPESGDYVFPEGLAPRAHRPRGGRRHLLGAERVDGPPGPGRLTLDRRHRCPAPVRGLRSVMQYGAPAGSLSTVQPRCSASRRAPSRTWRRTSAARSSAARSRCPRTRPLGSSSRCSRNWSGWPSGADQPAELR